MCDRNCKLYHVLHYLSTFCSNKYPYLYSLELIKNYIFSMAYEMFCIEAILIPRFFFFYFQLENVLMPHTSSFSTASSKAKPTGPTSLAKTSSPKKTPTAASSPDYSKNFSCTFCFVSFQNIFKAAA